MDSIWETNVRMSRFPRLEQDISTDVLIIGGGMEGLLCAWNLTKAGVDCVLIEENRIMSGVSGRITTKITSQHGLVYNKLLQRFGAEVARLYWRANEAARADFLELVKDVDCDFERQNSYPFHHCGVSVV